MSSPIVKNGGFIYNLCNYTCFAESRMAMTARSVYMYTGHQLDAINKTNDRLDFSTKEERKKFMKNLPEMLEKCLRK
jgi:hypothetical protein